MTTGSVLCLNCGMQVLTLADGSCPSCGAHGELVVRILHGKTIQTLVPTPADERSPVPRSVCLYLRPFAKRFRAAARMRAIAQAMRPFGTTVALHAREEFLGLKLVERGPVLTFITRIPRVGLLVSLPLLVWNSSIFLIALSQRAMFRWYGVKLVDVQDDRWRSTFRQLAFHSHLIVMDASA